MEGFKSDDSRLVKLFSNSREKWKKRVAEKQKRMRGMEVKIRDLSASRELWKEKALSAQEQHEQLERELEELKKSGCNRAEVSSACVAPRN
jgi:predicted  nucleic acid-binding Zn-ribbon protein